MDSQKQPVPAAGTSVQQQPQVPQHVQPVGGMKEGTPLSAPTEWISPSIPEMAPSQEVSQFVEVHTELPNLPQGVSHAKETTPVPTLKAEPLGLATPHPVLVALKKAHGNIKDSMRWLLEVVGIAKAKQERAEKEGGIV